MILAKKIFHIIDAGLLPAEFLHRIIRFADRVGSCPHFLLYKKRELSSFFIRTKNERISKQLK